MKALLALLVSCCIFCQAYSQEMSDAEKKALQLANDGNYAAAVSGFEIDTFG